MRVRAQRSVIPMLVAALVATGTIAGQAGLDAPPAAAAVAVPTEAIVPLEPARLLDTRPGESTVDGQASGEGRRAAGSTYELTVVGRGGVDADADAVMLNVTAVFPQGAGFLTVFPCGTDRPLASSVNYGPGDVVPNAVLAKIGTDGKVCIYSLAATDIVVDVNGFVPAGGSLATVEPARLLDTRPGEETVDGDFSGVGRVQAGGTVELTVAGRGGVTDEADAAMLNVTAVFPAAAGFLTIYPCGAPRPLASNVNYGPGDVVPNAALAKIGTGGKVCIYSLAATDIVVDVNGFVGAGGRLIPTEPQRFADSRPGEDTIDGLGTSRLQLRAGETRRIIIAGRGSVPTDAAAVLTNVTAVAPTDFGFLTVWPCDVERPLASNVNYGPGDVVPNAVLAKLSASAFCIFSLAPADIVIDVSAYVPFSAAPLNPPDCSASLASQAECNALTDIYNSMRTATSPPWTADTDPCGWTGVGCNNDGVVALDRATGFSGPVPSSIGDLAELTRLRLGGATSVPPEIGRLTKLTDLTLFGNMTDIPSSVGDLTDLTFLAFRSELASSIPASLGNLTKVTEMYLSGRYITALPTTLFDLPLLTRFEMDDTRLAAIPPEVARWDAIDILRLNGNRLTALPVELGDMAELRILELRDHTINSDITAAIRAIRDNNPDIGNVFMASRDACPIITDQAVADWLESKGGALDFGCSGGGGGGIVIGG